MEKKPIYSMDVLKSNLCNYNDVYILFRVNITIKRPIVTQVAFKTCARFIEYITKIDAEDIDLVMAIYNLLQCNLNYSDATGRLWFCSKDSCLYCE